MIGNSTKLLVDTPIYMRIGVSFAAGEELFFRSLFSRAALLELLRALKPLRAMLSPERRGVESTLSFRFSRTPS